MLEHLQMVLVMPHQNIKLERETQGGKIRNVKTNR